MDRENLGPFISGSQVLYYGGGLSNYGETINGHNGEHATMEQSAALTEMGVLQKKEKR